MAGEEERVESAAPKGSDGANEGADAVMTGGWDDGGVASLSLFALRAAMMHPATSRFSLKTWRSALPVQIFPRCRYHCHAAACTRGQRTVFELASSLPSLAAPVT